jgi:hypothetical protein
MSQLLKPRVVVGITGGIAAYKAATLVSKLVQRDCRVSVVLSHSAMHFVGAATFAALCNEQPVFDSFDSRWVRPACSGPCNSETDGELRLGRGELLAIDALLERDLSCAFCTGDEHSYVGKTRCSKERQATEGRWCEFRWPSFGLVVLPKSWRGSHGRSRRYPCDVFVFSRQF